jgi:hypothetical protein
VEPAQDWKRYDLCINSLDDADGLVYIDTWGGTGGKLWWDDLVIEEMGLVNVLRCPGCPVTVRGENGTAYEEGRDYDRIMDPLLHPWISFHKLPEVKIPSGSRITENKVTTSRNNFRIYYKTACFFILQQPCISRRCNRIPEMDWYGGDYRDS